MPSWNIHTAHVERLLAENPAEDLGIRDANAFLFGNYVPDLYVGFMVPDATYRIDYCLTHMAQPNTIPTPDADRYWDECIWHAVRRPSSPCGMSLALGVWAHLVADRMYNMRFHAFCQERETPRGDELRTRKQADFELFGKTLGISRHVRITPELAEAARSFRQYSVLPDDVKRAVAVADAIVEANAKRRDDAGYRLLSAQWLSETFDACHDRLESWLRAWMQLDAAGSACSATDIRAHLGC